MATKKLSNAKAAKLYPPPPIRTMPTKKRKTTHTIPNYKRLSSTNNITTTLPMCSSSKSPTFVAPPFPHRHFAKSDTNVPNSDSLDNETVAVQTQFAATQITTFSESEQSHHVHHHMDQPDIDDNFSHFFHPNDEAIETSDSETVVMTDTIESFIDRESKTDDTLMSFPSTEENLLSFTTYHDSLCINLKSIIFRGNDTYILPSFSVKKQKLDPHHYVHV
eukprot:72614_1